MSFFKKLLGLEEEEISDEIRAARARHGIQVDETEHLKSRNTEMSEDQEDYDAWDELKNIRTNFFLGSWGSRRYRRATRSDDKLREELEKVAREREEKERLKAERQQNKQ